VSAPPLRVLREAVAKNAPVAVIPLASRDALTDLLSRIEVANHHAPHPSPKVQTAVQRLRAALATNDLKTASVREVDVLMTFAATMREAA
jgi:hypothetical protein